MSSTPEYQASNFIDRPEALLELNRWASASTEKRVKSLIGPPGSGKTWILKKLESEWNDPCFFLLWLDVPKWINPPTSKDPINSRVAHDLLEEVWLRVKSFCDFPDLIDHSADFASIIEKLVEIVCNCCVEHDPVVIVDGYDEINEDQARAFSKRVLEPFISRRCIRMVLAYRDDWPLQGDTLRINESKPPLYLGFVDKIFAVKQFRRLLPNDSHTDKELTDWMNKLKHYTWNIPLINDILFSKGFNYNYDPQVLEPQDFYDSFKEVIERPDSQGIPRYQMLDRDQIELIYKIAHQLPDEWSSTAVEECFGMSSFYLDNRIQRFFELGLIAQNGNIHQIAAGLGELLREISDLDTVSY